MPRILHTAFVLLSLVPATWAHQRPTYEVRWDYIAQAEPTGRELRAIEVVDRTPLFANAPFLRLRAGDHLIRAVSGPVGKDVISGETRIGYYLQTAGARYSLEVEEKDGQLRLSTASLNPVFFFDWEVTAANATALYALLYQPYMTMLSYTQWQAITEGVRKEFPALPIDSWPGYGRDRDEHSRPPRLITAPGQSYAVFSGVALDSHDNEIYHFQLFIGPHLARITSRTLLQGPPHVDRYEFEVRPASIGLNASGSFPIDPATAKIKKGGV